LEIRSDSIAPLVGRSVLAKEAGNDHAYNLVIRLIDERIAQNQLVKRYKTTQIAAAGAEP